MKKKKKLLNTAKNIAAREWYYRNKAKKRLVINKEPEKGFITFANHPPPITPRIRLDAALAKEIDRNLQDLMKAEIGKATLIISNPKIRYKVTRYAKLNYPEYKFATTIDKKKDIAYVSLLSKPRSKH